MLATYEIVCSAGYDADTSAAVKSFLTVAANDGQGGLSSAGYVPLPEQFRAAADVHRRHQVTTVRWRGNEFEARMGARHR